MNGTPEHHQHSATNYYRDQATTSERTFHGFHPGGAAIMSYSAEAAGDAAVSAAQEAVDALANEDAQQQGPADDSSAGFALGRDWP